MTHAKIMAGDCWMQGLLWQPRAHPPKRMRGSTKKKAGSRAAQLFSERVKQSSEASKVRRCPAFALIMHFGL
jgi:hypothetical protein